MKLKSLIRGAIFVSTLSVAPQAAHAEGFLDIFGGQSWTTRTDLNLRVENATVNGVSVPAEVQVDIEGLKPKNNPTVGARLGFWAGMFGFAIDGSTLDPNLQSRTVRARANIDFDETIFGQPVSIGTGQDVRVSLPELPLPTTVTLAALAMVRLPIAQTNARKHGIIQPYGFAGPVWLVTNESFDGKIGLRAGAGAKLQLGRNLGLFGEYRYTAVDNADIKAGSFSGSVSGINASTGDIIGRIDIRTHTVVGGVSLTF